MKKTIVLQTVPNNGSDGFFYNSCMWIAIQKFIEVTDKKIYTLGELRGIAQFEENNMSDFDLLNKKHVESLIKLCNSMRFNVKVFFYADNKLTDSIGDLMFDSDINGIERSRTANIAILGSNPGNHFELINLSHLLIYENKRILKKPLQCSFYSCNNEMMCCEKKIYTFDG